MSQDWKRGGKNSTLISPDEVEISSGYRTQPASYTRNSQLKPSSFTITLVLTRFHPVCRPSSLLFLYIFLFNLFYRFLLTLFLILTVTPRVSLIVRETQGRAAFGQP